MKGYVRATVADRLDITGDLAVFSLDWAEPYAFEPGQYVTLCLDCEGRKVKRAYSIVSAPHELRMELHIERVADGQLTPHLFELHRGDTLWARKKIVGHFTQEPSKRAHAMMATVTGAAPFISMVRAQQHALAMGALAAGDASRYLLLHGASDPAELEPYATQLTRLATEVDWFVYVPTVSRPWNHPGWTGERGRVGDVLRKHLDAWTEQHGLAPADVVGYACGNPQMIEHAKGVLKRTGLGADFIREEKYYTDDVPKPAAVFDAATQAARRAKPVPSAASGARSPGKRPPLPPGLAKLKAVKPGRGPGAAPPPGRRKR